MNKLSFSDHSRAFRDFKYIYPVVSRRSQGLSVGINLNINNACNWRCIYCQVENLVRGKPIAIDLIKLEAELDEILNLIENSNFLNEYLPKNLRRFNDICISGNGEPTLSEAILDTTQIINKLRIKYDLSDMVKTILITNGSELDKPYVQSSIRMIAQNNGEIWFKIDRAQSNSISQVNQVNLSLEHIKRNLKLSSSLCKTYIQTCWFETNGLTPSMSEIEAYINLIIEVKPYIAGVLMYSIARTPALIEGKNLSPVSIEFLEEIAKTLEQYEIKVKYYT